MNYADMCDELRTLMVEEVEHDGDNLYLSAYFTPAGADAWKELLIAACQNGDDMTLAASISQPGYILTRTNRRTKSGHIAVRVPYDAHETIADSNFSRFYLRALCRLAEGRGINELIGYRAMAVEKPRSGSEEKIGALFPVQAMLADIRATMHGNPQLGMPPGVGSGILARLP